MFFLVSTSVVFVLISVVLTEFCAEFECFSQDLTDVIDSAANSTTCYYVTWLCITVSRDREQPVAPAQADKQFVAQTSSADSFRFRFVCPM